ncbi:MAG: molybdopterin-dependent oxidoreductase [Bacillota bacterium]|jgi:CO/xanthine dehydrogenase Mo-binding subunit/aerobic-type carbon monoxide dehydrogenase small subunit (CoxS/CutS family)
MRVIRFTVNGQPVEAKAKDKQSLLSFLREELKLTGTKNGCSTGHCGACTVIVDGEAKRSCLLPLKQMEGKSVLTIESLAADGKFHPIQEAFLAAGAVQCGFCTPGMIMAAKALLDRHPRPSQEQIMQGLKNNICRCTGYTKIIEAVQLAGRLAEGKQYPEEKGGGLGASLPDIDGEAKVTGKLQYADDLDMEGLQHVKVLWAEHPHAQILDIDITEAQALPGVTAVLTAKDIPGENGIGTIKPDQPVLCGEKVRFLGDAVALVVAETEEIAQAAVDLIKVRYQVLPGVFTPQEALQETSAKLYPEGNICKHLVHQVGDVEQAKARAHIVVEGHFETPFVEHAYLEPESSVSFLDEKGVLTVYGPTQFPFEIKKRLQAVLNLPEDRIRIIVTPLGGAFGGKIDGPVEYMTALAAYCTGKPVKLTLSREESMRMSAKRHPYIMDYQVGADQEGKLLFVDAKLLSDAGPYSGLSPRVIDQACIFACGPYVVPNIRVEGWAVFTNNANSGAFRGFGINQAAVAIESLLDEIALKLGMDRFHIRLKNALDVGSETASGEILKASVAIKETIKQAKAALEKDLPRFQEMYRGSRKKLGIGVASGFKNVGAGKGKVDDAGAIVELKPDGGIQVRVSAVDMGQGIRTTMAQIAAETLNLPAQSLEIITGDTSLTPRHGGAVGERQTLISGNAMYHAARIFKEKLLNYAGEIYRLDPAQLELQEGAVRGKDGKLVCSLADLASQVSSRGDSIRADYFYVAPKTYALADKEARAKVPKEEYRNYPAYAYTTQVAIVEVDPDSGQVKLLKVIAAHDVGRSINPQKIEGQIQGSCSMGQGYALSEEYPVEKGIHKARSFRQLGVPKIDETPEYQVLIVEDPEPTGPYGAKGISEVATVPITPAILNAIYDAVGVRIYTLPATPARIKEALEKN